MALFIFAQPFQPARIIDSNLDWQFAMKQFVPVFLALIPLVAVVSACVSVP